MQVRKIAATVAVWGFTTASGAAQPLEHLSIGFREDAPPFVSLSEGKVAPPDAPPVSAYEGFAADICREVLTSMQEGAQEKFRIDAFPVNAANRFRDQSGQKRVFDMLCDTTSITRERMEFCSFSFPYFVTGISFATLGQRKRISDIKGAEIGLIGGTTAVERLNVEWKRRFGELPNITSLENYEVGVAAITTGDIEVLFGDQILLEQANGDTGGTLTISNDVISTELYGLCVNPERPELLRKVNETLAELYASGRIYGMFNDHFGDRGASRLLVMLYAFYAVPEN